MAKRRHKVRKPKPKVMKRSTKLWPIVYCTSEELCIGVSRVAIAVGVTSSGKTKAKKKVDHTQWKHWNSTFRDGYEIDMSLCKVGEEVRCPKCGELVDFRVFPAHKPPEMTSVSEHYNKED